MTTSGIRHDIATAAAAAHHLLQAVAASLGTDDDELPQLVVAGETTLVEAIGSALDRIAELEGHCKSLALRKLELDERKSRFTVAIEALRTSICSALETTGMQKIELPSATVSCRRVPPSVVISEPGMIPASYLVPQPPIIDKRAVLAALKDRQVVPGAELSNGGTTIAIRRS